MSESTTVAVGKQSLRLPIFIIVLLLFTAHSFLMNGHKHVYNRLTVGTYVDPIAADADPSLFKNSIYVQAVKRTNVRLNVIYDLYPWVYKHFDFETFAIIQEIVSLFFMLAAVFALSRAIFGGTATGCVAMLLYTAELNNWTLGSPAPYLNFFHHGLHYNYPFLAWSLVFFLYKRFPLSLFLAGCAWNFHPMCTVFLLFTYGVYWLFNMKKFPLRTILLSAVAFTVPAMPILIKAFAYTGNTGEVHELWFKGVYWGAWYTCNPLTWPAKWIIRAGLFFAVFGIALFYVPKRDMRKTVGVLVFAVGLLCVVGTVFADLYPVPFIIRLSLWRATFVYLLLALPCIAYLLVQLWQKGLSRRFFVIMALTVISGYVPGLNYFYMPAVILFMLLAVYEQQLTRMLPLLQGRLPLFMGVALLATLAFQGARGAVVVPVALFFAGTLLIMLLAKRAPSFLAGKTPAWILPALLVLFFDICVLLSTGGPSIYYHGMVRGKVDPWADIQKVAKRSSHKDDLFIIPPYLNDFGIYSQRATIGDWPEGGNIIYLDGQFAREWFDRMYDIGWRERFGAKEGYGALTTDEVRSAARKYGALFVITEKPKEFSLPKLYENKEFILYRLN
jgi:hypothetical protein